MAITFEAAIANTLRVMKLSSKRVKRGKWQGVDVSKRPEMEAYEICHHSLRIPMPTKDLDYYRKAIKPNLPWADDHFLERVCGQPINPGVEWRNWPWGKNAEKFLNHNGVMFDHNYMERYWPKVAGGIMQPSMTAEDFEQQANDQIMPHYMPHYGIRYEYGDLSDVVKELADDPTTRQAILPVFFPEDTGLRPGRRKPCSLHYHFMLNDGKLDIQYVLRSCDLIRHFRDDIYLTVRLLLWMIDQLGNSYKPGLFVMHIANLHCFVNDRPTLESEPS